MAHPARIAIVGCGVTGSVVFSLLKDKFPSIVLWEKARGVGGRFTTHRSEAGSSHADLGAQYITFDKGNERLRYVDALVGAGVLKPFDLPVVNTRGAHDEQAHFTAPEGLSAVPKHFLADALDQNSSHAVHFNKKLVSVDKTAENQWRLTAQDGEQLDVNGVVLTMPLPQLLELQGSISALLLPYKPVFDGIQYSRRFAMALYYDQKDWKGFESIPWAGRYVKKEEDEVLVWISIDPRKCQLSEDDESVKPVVVLHSSVPWGIRHFEDDDAYVEQMMRASLSKIVPELPEPSETKLLRWHYSQVREPVTLPAVAGISGHSQDTAAVDADARPQDRGSEAGDLLALKLAPAPHAAAAEKQLAPHVLVAAGDGFSGSNFGNCIRSAERAAAMVDESLGALCVADEQAAGGAMQQKL